MNDILKTYMERFRENRHTLRRYTAFGCLRRTEKVYR